MVVLTVAIAFTLPSCSSALRATWSFLPPGKKARRPVEGNEGKGKQPRCEALLDFVCHIIYRICSGDFEGESLWILEILGNQLHFQKAFAEHMRGAKVQKFKTRATKIRQKLKSAWNYTAPNYTIKIYWNIPQQKGETLKPRKIQKLLLFCWSSLPHGGFGCLQGMLSKSKWPWLNNLAEAEADVAFNFDVPQWMTCPKSPPNSKR